MSAENQNQNCMQLGSEDSETERKPWSTTGHHPLYRHLLCGWTERRSVGMMRRKVREGERGYHTRRHTHRSDRHTDRNRQSDTKRERKRRCTGTN